MFKHNRFVKHGLIMLPLLAVFFTTEALSSDQDAVGVWQTESSDKGYLHVSIEQCDKSLCGTILRAYNLQDEINTDYEHIGKSMVWGMESSSDSNWKGGKIWDPSSDKTYNSKMTLKDDVLSVSGCVLFICKAQAWVRVQ